MSSSYPGRLSGKCPDLDVPLAWEIIAACDDPVHLFGRTE